MNPIIPVVRLRAAKVALARKEGADWFQPSNIESPDLGVGNPATNVIPSEAKARISIRFNDRHSGAGLVERIRAIVESEGGELLAKISGEPFLTPPGEFSDMIAAAITQATGLEPELSTSGGTSDARFLSRLCPVVEFGLCNATMHKLDEAVAAADLENLTTI